jgi:hypothetical protein
MTKQSKRNVSAICAISRLFVSIAPTGAVWADDSSGLPNVPQIQLEDPNARPFTLAPNPDPSLSGAEREQLELQDPSRVISELVSGGVLIPFKPQMEKDENGDSEMVVIGTDEQQQPKKVKWNRNLGWATLVVATTEVAAVTLMTQLPNTVTGWTGRNPKLWHIKESFTEGPRIDHDHWYWNYLAHPWEGAEFYLVARNRGANFWQSALFSFGMSAFWEFGPEAVYERASIQDLIVTPGVGALIGEARYQAVKAMRRREGQGGRARQIARKAMIVILDPVEAMSR